MTELPLVPRDVVPLAVDEFTFVFDLESGPDFADLCSRFRDDTNRAVVWLLRFKALQTLRGDLRLARSAHATGSTDGGSFVRGAFEVAATQPLNEAWEFDRPAFFAAVNALSNEP